jgi:hypothetical protein
MSPQLNRYELLALAHPRWCAARDGPRPTRRRLSTQDRESAPASLRRTLVERLAAVASDTRRRPRPTRGQREALPDRDAYLELEFAVGFCADDEPWL